MPGSSLWLLPPEQSECDMKLSDLIGKTSSLFDSTHRFLPHITLTSGIPPSVYGSNPQAWLEKIEFEAGGKVQISFEKLASEDVFFRKLYLKCSKHQYLKNIAGECKRSVEGYSGEGRAKSWVENEYNPHVSLMYHDCPVISADGLLSIGELAQEVGVSIGREDLVWTGGRVVLVPTDKPISQWTPIAKRAL